MKASLPPQAAPRSTPETRVKHTGKSPCKIPFTVIIDTREQAGFEFRGLVGDSDRQYRSLLIPTIRQGLKTGDYSIVGFSVASPANNFKAITVERKSIADLYGSLTWGDNLTNFEEEHQRMLADYILHGGEAHVVIEGNYGDIEWRDYGPSPAGIKSLQIKFSRLYRVHWHYADSKALAEDMTFRLLDDFYHAYKHELQPEALKESNT